MANRHCERMLNIANLLEKGKSKYNDLTLVRKSSLKILQVTNAGEGVELPCDPAIPILGVYLDKTIIQKYTCNPMFIVALFTILKIWKQLKCPSTDE